MTVIVKEIRPGLVITTRQVNNFVLHTLVKSK
jgi:hypothetical protein